MQCTCELFRSQAAYELFAAKDNDVSDFSEIHYSDGFEEELSSSLTRAVLKIEVEC